MKRNVVFALGLGAIIAASCSKPVDNPKPVPAPITDARKVLLKEVLIDHLPSPYFQFTYNDSNYVTNIDFAQQLVTWQVYYENKRVKKMINTRNNDQLLYSYAEGRVMAIKHIDAANGKPKWHHDFTYYGNGQLKQIRWWNFESSNGDSILQRKVVLIYQPDGNLSEFDEYRRNTNDETVWTSTVELKDYDQGTNVDDFYLFKDFFDDILFLPQVKFQKNNARQISVKGVDTDYKIDYSFQYNANNLPTVKTFTLLMTRGPEAGKQFTGKEQFSY